MATTSDKKANNSVSQFPDVYGFILWIFIRVGSVLYLIWAFVPDSVWHLQGITYYPSRYWAVAVPTYFCVSWWCLIIGYVGYNYYNTNDWSSIHTIKDGFAECPIEAHKADMKQIKHSISWSERYSTNIVPPVPNCCDLDIKDINELLFDNLVLE
eukprot:195850_1